MASPSTETMATANASDPPSWYNSLTPEDQILYWKAYDDDNKAEVDHQAAVAKARDDEQKTLNVHTDAKNASIKANKAVTNAVTEANAKLKALAKLAGDYDATNIKDGAKAKDQGDSLQGSLEAVKTALAELVKARVEAEAKLKILIEKSQSPVTDPEQAEIKKATVLQAKAQRDMDVAKADIPREAAKDLFAVKKAELRARLPKVKRPDPVKSSAQAD